MNLYLIEQEVNDDYDTYDSAVVAAESEDEARKTHPSGNNFQNFNPITRLYDLPWWKGEKRNFTEWAYKLEDVQVTYLGIAKEGTEAGVICASFNAG